MIRRTPGPWRVSRSWNGQQHVVESTVGSYRVATVQWSEDARLVAAAPALLEAVSEMMTCIVEQGSLTVDHECVIRACRALEEAGATVTPKSIDIVGS